VLAGHPASRLSELLLRVATLEVESSPCYAGSMRNRSKNRRECCAGGIVLAAFGLLMLISVAHAAEWVRFDSPDERAATILDNLLREELTRPGSNYEYVPEAAEGARTAWVRVTDTEPPFLFVMLQGAYCGSGGCAIYGFCNIKDKWQRVYFHAGGEGIYLLDTSTKLHRDIRHTSRSEQARRLRASRDGMDQYTARRDDGRRSSEAQVASRMRCIRPLVFGGWLSIADLLPRHSKPAATSAAA
jgi:hypothetical protein